MCESVQNLSHFATTLDLDRLISYVKVVPQRWPAVLQKKTRFGVGRFDLLAFFRLFDRLMALSSVLNHRALAGWRRARDVIRAQRSQFVSLQ